MPIFITIITPPPYHHVGRLRAKRQEELWPDLFHCFLSRSQTRVLYDIIITIITLL